MTSPLYLCVHVRDFAAQALTRSYAGSHPSLHPSLHPSSHSGKPRPLAVAVLSGDPPLERVFAINQSARLLGMRAGMSREQAESFHALVLRRDRQQEDISFAELVGCAQQFSPRIESVASPQDATCGATLVLDISGSERLLGSPLQIATSVRQSLCDIGYEASVAVSQNAYATVLAARGLAGTITIAPECEAETLAPLPLTVLELDNAQAETFVAWGIHTLGQVAALPTKSLVARMGQIGLGLQAQARGEYGHLLVPAEEPADAALCESMELEHPVELLEPLLFLLSQMLEQVLQRAAQRALAIASVETCLTLEGKALALQALPHEGNAREETSRRSVVGACRKLRRTVRPALPERNRLVLLKLIQLDLELHPPEAAVIALHIEAHPARPQTAQQGLFAAQAPEAGRLEILLARLRKLVGEGRVGAPELLDTHGPKAFRVANFELTQVSAPLSSRRTAQPAASFANQSESRGAPHQPQSADMGHRALALRMVRPPCAIAVELHGDTPSAMYYENQRLLLQTSSGPWRTSGAWWTHPAWCREEWDVMLEDEVLKEKAQRCLRLAHDPAASCWYVIGIYD
jgi:protein ImuB